MSLGMNDGCPRGERASHVQIAFVLGANEGCYWRVSRAPTTSLASNHPNSLLQLDHPYLGIEMVSPFLPWNIALLDSEEAKFQGKHGETACGDTNGCETVGEANRNDVGSRTNGVIDWTAGKILRSRRLA